MLENEPTSGNDETEYAELRDYHNIKWKEHADKAQIAGVFALTGFIHPVLSLVFLTEAFRQCGLRSEYQDKRLELHKHRNG